MALYWSMTLLGQKENISPITIDEEMCNALNVECDADKYYQGWWDCAGMAGTFAKLRELATDDESRAVVSYLEERYELHTWHQRGANIK